MTSLDVMLKGTDDDASSGFFPRASAEPLRADALQGLVCLAIPQEKAGMLGHPLFLSECIHKKEATHPLLRRLRESKRRRSGFGGPWPPNTS
ncbi:hypothetical protein BCL52_1512 [Salisediminibacterium halotolerans]|uniref:hypothetical protein n=1 Tax=Salisediminibacterium halotolerans TaxID=517425 RepID=UPI000F200F3F|nr:hypothetical protein [Salisediminibacterium halotolerans]RLJ74227.1 hypothetical protein BCL39_1515 [Actinophytocola xinjiangensis]TWG35064.1 hypothetical protein BCL52_1512 [Salisediminibacterium halotolerans]